MRNKIALSIAALMSASLLTSPVLAQVSVGGDVGVDTGVSVGTDAGGADVSGGAAAGADAELRTQKQIDAQADTDAGSELDAGTTAAIGGSFDGALSAIGNNSASASSISAMTDVSSVNVIRISELDGADMDALMSAETENTASIDELQGSIEGNAAVMAALEAQSVDPENVVAADVAADGSLTVYVK